MIGNERAISAIAVFIGFGTAILLAPQAWRRHKDPDRRVFALWIICWCFGLGSLINIDSPYLFVGKVSDIPNLGWLLVNLSLVIGIYCVLVVTSRTLQLSQYELRILWWITLVFVVAMTILFFLSKIAFSYPNLVRSDASSLMELVYLNAVYVYEIAIFFRPWLLFLRMFTGSHSLESRIRSGALVIVFSCSIMYSALRIFSSSAQHYSLITDATLIYALQMAMWITFTPALTLWPLTFIPTQWFEFFRQVRQLYHLKYLYRRIHDDCGQSLSIPLPQWWTQIAQAAFYNNAITVFVLDIKWLMANNRLTLNDESLATLIANLDDTLPRKQFVAECVEQSRNLQCQGKPMGRKVGTESHARSTLQAS